ncbi:hypothetical protein GALMADRAFT_278337 [Galerina marginata CBS 339.88]|uniref:Uncharacterized protein n=1 Tax=Galerina marginata (strain CBS 339.88) TaxID=685588 RepID=A0A067TG98_GALM3|nr:hypothetical protein GALMADRAFT_278337 [Galerina marginata CBS 339.88]
MHFKFERWHEGTCDLAAPIGTVRAEAEAETDAEAQAEPSPAPKLELAAKATSHTGVLLSLVLPRLQLTRPTRRANPHPLPIRGEPAHDDDGNTIQNEMIVQKEKKAKAQAAEPSRLSVGSRERVEVVAHVAVVARSRLPARGVRVVGGVVGGGVVAGVGGGVVGAGVVGGGSGAVGVDDVEDQVMHSCEGGGTGGRRGRGGQRGMTSTCTGTGSVESRGRSIRTPETDVDGKPDAEAEIIRRSAALGRVFELDLGLGLGLPPSNREASSSGVGARARGRASEVVDGYDSKQCHLRLRRLPPSSDTPSTSASTSTLWSSSYPTWFWSRVHMRKDDHSPVCKMHVQSAERLHDQSNGQGARRGRGAHGGHGLCLGEVTRGVVLVFCGVGAGYGRREG